MKFALDNVRLQDGLQKSQLHIDFTNMKPVALDMVPVVSRGRLVHPYPGVAAGPSNPEPSTHPRYAVLLAH